MQDSLVEQGWIHALVLNGRGGARRIAPDALQTLQLKSQESLWLHLDRGSDHVQAWLREQSGLGAFSCDLLLEENTRPRLVALSEEGVLLFMRGINLNPGAQPEDMVSLRISAGPQCVISLRMRPLRTTDALVVRLLEGCGPKTTAGLLLHLADDLTDRIDDLVMDMSDVVDLEEERLEQDERCQPDHHRLLALRRRAAGLRRFLLPQRELFAQLARLRLSWMGAGEADYWNETGNRLVRQLEELDLVRERANLLLESGQRRLGERMNRTMYILAIVTGFFLPISFLTGLLGINVGGLPGANSPFGFLVACLVIMAVVLFQWCLFRRLRWL